MIKKPFILGTVAGLTSFAAAHAADLPMTKGEAVEYVKVCTAFGPGFFYIPGSDTCLRIGSEFRIDYRIYGGGKFNRDDNRTAFNAQARVWFDARTETEYGLLRSYFQINADSNTATRVNGTEQRNRFTIDKAFIQFGGLTAGYAHSFFGFYDNDYGNTIFGPYYAQSNTVNLIAYTAQFGGGFSATLSIEDGRDHRQNDVFAYQGGQQVPDVVGVLRLDQAWGTVALQAAAHQFRSASRYDNGTPDDPADDVALRHQNKWGYAIGADVLIKIPQLEDGHLVIEGQYADGALDYLGADNLYALRSQDFYYRNGFSRLEAGKGWSITAELGGNFTPQWGFNIVPSYIDTRYDGAGINGQDLKAKEYAITGNLTYMIVKGLSVTGEISYIRSEFDRELGNETFADNRPKEKLNSVVGGIRIKRMF